MECIGEILGACFTADCCLKCCEVPGSLCADLGKACCNCCLKLSCDCCVSILSTICKDSCNSCSSSSCIYHICETPHCYSLSSSCLEGCSINILSDDCSSCFHNLCQGLSKTYLSIFRWLDCLLPTNLYLTVGYDSNEPHRHQTKKKNHKTNDSDLPIDQEENIRHDNEVFDDLEIIYESKEENKFNEDEICRDISSSGEKDQQNDNPEEEVNVSDR